MILYTRVGSSLATADSMATFAELKFYDFVATILRTSEDHGGRISFWKFLDNHVLDSHLSHKQAGFAKTIKALFL